MKFFIYYLLFSSVNVLAYTNDLILTSMQQKYKSSIHNFNIPIVLCTGPAGTGKTMIACTEAISLLKLKKINKIIITRPTITVEENIGFLPGNIEEKLFPFMIPIYDYFSEYYNKEQVKMLINRGKLEIAPLAFMRGRTFSDAIIIADEMQNSSKNQFKMLLTRIGENSKLIITGDLQQNDLGKDNGLNDFLDLLDREYKNNELKIKDGFDHINFENTDIKRSAIISKILNIYDKDI